MKLSLLHYHSVNLDVSYEQTNKLMTINSIYIIAQTLLVSNILFRATCLENISKSHL